MTGAHTRSLDDLRGCDEPIIRRQERGPGRAARGRDPGPARVCAGDLGARRVAARGRPRAARRARARGRRPGADRFSAEPPRGRSAMRSARRRCPARSPTSSPSATTSSQRDDERAARPALAAGGRAIERRRRGQRRRDLRRPAGDAVMGARRRSACSPRCATAGRACTARRRSPTAPSSPRAAPPAMGVAVQLMVDAAVSGVMFTCNPVSGDPSMVAINASWGLGSAVVDGEVTPDDYLLSKVTGEIVREQISAKHVQCVPRDDGHGTELVDVPAERRELPMPRTRRARGAGRARGPGAAPLRLPPGHRVGDRAVEGAARQPGRRPVAPGDRRRRGAAIRQRRSSRRCRW